MKQKSTGTHETTIIGTQKNTKMENIMHNITCKQKLEKQVEYLKV